MNDCNHATLESPLASTVGLSESSTRRAHLINSIRVWLNRAISHAENGNADKAESAVRSAREILSALETLRQ